MRTFPPSTGGSGTLAALHAAIAERDARIVALEKTVRALADHVERRLRMAASADEALFEQHLALERVVARKTRELEKERAKLERTLHALGAAQAKLLQSQKLEAVGQLAAGIAHEINTPMQYVGDNMGFLRVAFGKIVALLDDLLTHASTQEGALSALLEERAAAARIPFLRERIPRAIEQSLEGLDAIAHIVVAMKEFSHPGTGEPEPCDVNHILQNTLTVSRNEWKYVADVETRLDPSLPRVLGFGHELSQVFLNLVVNAAHAIAAAPGPDGERGTITVTTRSARGGEAVEVRVMDTGPGVPPAIRDRVFDPYFTTKDVGKGTGQGLAIARSIVVDKHHGTLDLDDAPGGGATFVVVLPVGEALPSEGLPA